MSCFTISCIFCMYTAMHNAGKENNTSEWNLIIFKFCESLIVYIYILFLNKLDCKQKLISKINILNAWIYIWSF